MSKIKTLSSGLTAAALVAGIGIAYAQATDPAAQPTAPAAQPSTSEPATTPNSSTPPSTTTTPSSTDSQTMGSEPAAQADRN